MNNSSFDHQLQISGDPSLVPQPVSSAVQHALLGVVNSRSGVMTSYVPTAYNLTSQLGAIAKRKYTHSKILTAQGLRDRRVRLSVEIARRFFDLQEMLGYNMASKTLEWLLGKASCSIDALTQGKTTGLISSCGIGVDGVCSSLGSKFNGIMPRNGKGKNATPVSGMKCTKISNVVARDQSRAKARARARERTISRALMGAQLDVFPGDLLASQSPHSNIVSPSTTGKHHQISLLDDELNLTKQNAATAGKVTSLDFLHYCHKELATSSDVNNFESFEVSLPKEWDA